MANLSLFSNGSLLHPHLSSTNSPFFPLMNCLISRPSSLIFIVFFATYTLLLLPLSALILYHGLQRWYQMRSTSSATVMSHCDCFTFHLAIFELIGSCGSVLLCCGIYKEDLKILLGGSLLMSFIWHGELFFHVFTCAERYLAVVHPVTYRSLRTERGTRIRNVSIGCVWLLCFAWMGVMVIDSVINVVDFCVLVLAILITSFCSLSVLFVLIRPGPGDQDGDRAKVDQLKQRAFHHIVAILGVLVIRFAWGIVRISLHVIKGNEACVTIASGFWLSLPSSLVSPLLFLHRKGKLVCFKK